MVTILVNNFYSRTFDNTPNVKTKQKWPFCIQFNPFTPTVAIWVQL